MKKQIFYALTLLSISWLYHDTLSACQEQIAESQGIVIKSLGATLLSSFASVGAEITDDRPYNYKNMRQYSAYRCPRISEFCQNAASFLQRASVLPSVVGAVKCLRLATKVPQDQKNNLIGLGLIGIGFASETLNSEIRARRDSNPLKSLFKGFTMHPYAYGSGALLCGGIGYLVKSLSFVKNMAR
jgi:hypothetical protein